MYGCGISPNPSCAAGLFVPWMKSSARSSGRGDVRRAPRRVDRLRLLGPVVVRSEVTESVRTLALHPLRELFATLLQHAVEERGGDDTEHLLGDEAKAPRVARHRARASSIAIAKSRTEDLLGRVHASRRLADRGAGIDQLLMIDGELPREESVFVFREEDRDPSGRRVDLGTERRTFGTATRCRRDREPRPWPPSAPPRTCSRARLRTGRAGARAAAMPPVRPALADHGLIHGGFDDSVEPGSAKSESAHVDRLTVSPQLCHVHHPASAALAPRAEASRCDAGLGRTERVPALSCCQGRLRRSRRLRRAAPSAAQKSFLHLVGECVRIDDEQARNARAAGGNDGQGHFDPHRAQRCRPRALQRLGRRAGRLRERRARHGGAREELGLRAAHRHHDEGRDRRSA